MPKKFERIQMEVYIGENLITNTSLDVNTFPSGSGILTLLTANPDATVTVEAHTTKVVYKVMD